MQYCIYQILAIITSFQIRFYLIYNPLSYLEFDTTVLMATNLRFIGHMHVKKSIIGYFITTI